MKGSTLGDVIIAHGLYVVGDIVPVELSHPTAAHMNELREELIELRLLRDRVEADDHR